MNRRDIYSKQNMFLIKINFRVVAGVYSPQDDLLCLFLFTRETPSTNSVSSDLLIKAYRMSGLKHLTFAAAV